MGSKRSYSEADKASALALLKANGGNVKQTAKQLGMPRGTLSNWANGDYVNPDVTEKAHEKEDTLEEVFEQLARAYAQHALGEGVLADTKGKDAVIAAATALDKVRLLRGESTNIEEVRGESSAKRELADRLARQLAAARDGSARSPN